MNKIGKKFHLSTETLDLKCPILQLNPFSWSVQWECVLWCNSRLEKTVQPIVSLSLVPCERIHSAAQTYHSSPLLVAPGLKAAGAYRPAALVHLIPLHAPKDQSPPFVIGKHVKKLVCASHDKERGAGRGTEMKNKEDTKISIFSRDVRVCTKAQLLTLKMWVLILFSLMGVDAVYFLECHTVFSNLLPSAE